MMIPRHTTICSFSSSRAFTFVEILAAMLFMAIVIPIAIQGITIANRMGVVAERARTAAHLADVKLTELALTEAWRDGEQQGNFGDVLLDDEGNRYQWTLETTAWEKDTMREIAITVTYTVQGKDYTVRLHTLVEEEASTNQ